MATADLPEQAKIVHEILLKEGLFTPAVITKEVSAFFNDFGLPSVYFEDTPPETIAKHVLSLQSAKLLAKASGNTFNIHLEQENEDSALFAARSLVHTTKEKSTVRLVKGSSAESSPCRALERMIEDKYLSGGFVSSHDAAAGTSGIEQHFQSQIPADSLSKAHTSGALPEVWCMSCHRSEAAIDPVSGSHLRLYFLHRPDFVNPSPAEGETDITQLADKKFLERTDETTRGYYQTVVTEASSRLGPSIHVFRNSAEDSSDDAKDSLLLLVGFKSGSTHSYFTGISDVYRALGLFGRSKSVSAYSNNVVIYAFHLQALGPSSGDFEHRIKDLVRDCSLHYVLPRTSLTPLLSRQTLSAQEVAYAYAAWKFAYHFLNRGGDELSSIKSALAGAGSEASLAMVGKVRKALRTHAFTEGSILDCMYRNPSVIRRLYVDFMTLHDPGYKYFFADEKAKTSPITVEEAKAFLSQDLNTELDIETFTAMLTFNRHILKTNFFRSHKTALSFRLNPAFLNPADFPDKPFGLFFVIGSEFRGFHIRFRDVARGGIRVVRSAYPQAYASNVGNMFDECYNLANTQQRKNKDIPEGGSKGVILLNLAHQDKGRIAFQKFVDSIFDVLLPTSEVKDLLGSEEILFFGPDENTADYMDWAAQHARARGYRFWKAFTTGKSLALGGIPHDTYGMTTHSVRQYALGIQAKLGLTGADCFKVQTGGPDGDLGSNEIIMSNERTTAIVDGSGVLFDPKGIDHEELTRLAKARKMVSHVDKSKISAEGALVLITDKNITLPDGTEVKSGLSFRNSFQFSHLAVGDFFIPCGGRPAAVNLSNVDDFVRRPDGSLRFKYIVEGANLFFTQDARFKLESAGVIMFKDASANKGGVTSSSLEVMAALVLNDEEFAEHMSVAPVAASADGEESKAAEPPAFYKEYVKEAQGIIDHNAQLEFECIWKEHERCGLPRCKLTDLLSVKITELSARIEDNEVLCNNETLRSSILHDAVPKALAALLGGVDNVLERLPENYKRALFASRLASRFIYESGLETPEFAFFEYVSSRLS